jgi:ubiquinone/menaquinone biosynthesis C-methylase UbiE
MSIFSAMVKRLRSRSGRRASLTEPAEAYDLWAASYDDQPHNLMLHLDEMVFGRLLEHVDLRQKTVLDIGCGTGRHWPRILEQGPALLYGYDVSVEMLKRLHQKHPDAATCLLEGNALAKTKDASADVIISTLTVAHIEDLAGAFSEWNRVLRKDGATIITDYHPAAFEMGADRTFRHQGRLISVRNAIHPLSEVRALTMGLGWNESEFIELRIDESVRHYYEEQNALDVYRRFYHTPMIYGMRMSKA